MSIAFKLLETCLDEILFDEIHFDKRAGTIGNMGQPKEKLTVEQLLKLVDQLTPEEQEALAEEMKLKRLRRMLAETEAEASLDRDEGIPGEVVLEELRQRAEVPNNQGY
jgi:hypothetical protein